jgi:kynureninase
VRVQAVKDKWAGLRVKAGDNVNLARWRALQECVGNRIAQVTAAKRRELLACWTAYMGMACTEHCFLDVDVAALGGMGRQITRRDPPAPNVHAY